MSMTEAAYSLPNWTADDDWRVVSEVNEMARQSIAKKFGVLFPEGNRCDMGRSPPPHEGGSSFLVSVTILNEWRAACAEYQALNGIDPHECLTRHEAEIRRGL
jgi:hypothetical protein